MTNDSLDTRSHTVEEQVDAIWRDVLATPNLRPNATFLQLNGQSISAVQIANRIEDEIGVSVDVNDLFEDPDLESFARHVARKAQETGR